jgi:hypothetical protein
MGFEVWEHTKRQSKLPGVARLRSLDPTPMLSKIRDKEFDRPLVCLWVPQTDEQLPALWARVTKIKWVSQRGVSGTWWEMDLRKDTGIEEVQKLLISWTKDRRMTL